MNFKVLAAIFGIVGVLLVAIAGNAVARQAGFGESGWLMLVFALGIVLLGQASILRLQQKVRYLEARLAGGSAA